MGSGEAGEVVGQFGKSWAVVLGVEEVVRVLEVVLGKSGRCW